MLQQCIVLRDWRNGYSSRQVAHMLSRVAGYAILNTLHSHAWNDIVEGLIQKRSRRGTMLVGIAHENRNITVFIRFRNFQCVFVATFHSPIITYFRFHIPRRAPIKNYKIFVKYTINSVGKSYTTQSRSRGRRRTCRRILKHSSILHRW
jgi:hypothetical protein